MNDQLVAELGKPRLDLRDTFLGAHDEPLTLSPLGEPIRTHGLSTIASEVTTHNEAIGLDVASRRRSALVADAR
jgi:hypothetical protein